MTGQRQKIVASHPQELLKMQPPGPGLERKRPFTGDVKPNTQNYQEDRACPVFFVVWRSRVEHFASFAVQPARPLAKTHYTCGSFGNERIIIQRDTAVGHQPVIECKDKPRDDGCLDELPDQPRSYWRRRLVTLLYRLSCFMGRLHPEWQHGEQHQPPDDENTPQSQ